MKAKGKIDEHSYTLLPLYETFQEETGEDDGWALVNCLRAFLKKDLSSPTNCPNCGGLLPELSFEYDGKYYYFTCYMIKGVKDGKIIAQTDYEKFSKYADFEHYRVLKETQK